MSARVRIDGVRFRYHRGTPWVLDDISAAFEPGITAIVGPNGSGKSTLVRIAASLLRPAHGAVAVDDRSVGAMAPAERATRIAYIAQRPEMSAGFSTREVVELGRFALMPSDRAVDGALERVGISGLAHRPWRELSVGQQQLASVARALAQLGGPGGDGVADGVVLADEPTSAMDPDHVARTVAVLREMASAGATVVMVAHDVPLARAVADRAVVLGGGGRIVSQGPARETLAPGPLAQVFGVPFVEARSDAGVMVAPESQFARGV